MSAEASDWHPPQEGMHSHMARGPLASLSENVTAVPDGEEVRISRVMSFLSAVSSFRKYTSLTRPRPRSNTIPGVDVFINR